jgi:hypothetical protein
MSSFDRMMNDPARLDALKNAHFEQQKVIHGTFSERAAQETNIAQLQTGTQLAMHGTSESNDLLAKWKVINGEQYMANTQAKSAKDVANIHNDTSMGVATSNLAGHLASSGFTLGPNGEITVNENAPKNILETAQANYYTGLGKEKDILNRVMEGRTGTGGVSNPGSSGNSNSLFNTFPDQNPTLKPSPVAMPDNLSPGLTSSSVSPGVTNPISTPVPGSAESLSEKIRKSMKTNG